MYGVIFACISKINQTGCFLGFCAQMRKIDKIGTKRRKVGKFWWKSPKKMRKKNTNLINTRYLIIAQGGFFSKNNKRTVSNKHVLAGFWTQKQ